MANLQPDWTAWFQRKVSEPDFALRREPLMCYSTYELLFREHLGGMASVTIDLPKHIAKSRPSGVMVSTRRRLRDVLDWISLQYSSGAAMTHIVEAWSHALTWAEAYGEFDAQYHASPEAENHVTPHATLRDEEYWIVALRMVCFGILSGGARDMPRVMAFLDYGNAAMGVRDGLIERLVAPFVGDRGALPDGTTRGLPYRKLLPLFDAAPQDRPAMMGRYLQDWYRDSRREPYFNQHGEADVSFYGYWSWEAAAATVVLDIDDGAYCDMPYYPKDWVDHARGLNTPTATGR